MKELIPRKTAGKRVAALILGLAALFLLSGCAGREQPEAAGKQKDMAKNQEISVQETGSGFSHTGYGKEGLTVYFLDVGQGNAVLAKCQGHYMLIDGGEESKTSYVVEYLKSLGVDRLDYVVASHYDEDHLSGVVEVLKTYDCGLVLSGDYQVDTNVYKAYRSAVEKMDIQEIHPRRGETYRLGGAVFTIVCPMHYDHELENDNSIGLRLVYKDTSFLICGDASRESEEEMLRSGEALKSDVYMASHHGSRSSNSWRFLKGVDPEAVVISAGYGNPYGHPVKTVMKRIQRLGADLYRTDLQGDLTAVSDGEKITWNVNSCMNYRNGGQALAA